MTGVFCAVTFFCGAWIGAVVGINLYEDWRERR